MCCSKGGRINNQILGVKGLRRRLAIASHSHHFQSHYHNTAVCTEGSGQASSSAMQDSVQGRPVLEQEQLA